MTPLRESESERRGCDRCEQASDRGREHACAPRFAASHPSLRFPPQLKAFANSLMASGADPAGNLSDDDDGDADTEGPAPDASAMT